MARSFTAALLALLVVHLLAAVWARQAPEEPKSSGGSRRSVDVLHSSLTNTGPSPATGHGSHPPADVTLGGELNAASGVSSVPGTASVMFSPSPCISHGDPPATDKSSSYVKHLSASDVEASGVRP